jgi:signal transduction histidine kinase
MSVQQFTGATHRLRLQLGDDVLLVCDPDLAATAILNLLDNAMKYSPTDEEVILSTHLEGDQCIIEIVDRGPGVSPEMRETIFDRYVRAPEHANIPGTGVGLSLVRSIATTHQGSIEVLDDESGGAKFRLALSLRMTTTMSGIDS